MKRPVLLSPVLLWFGITLVWGVYRYLLPEREVVEELLIKPLIYIVPLLLYLRRNKQLTLGSLGIIFRNKRQILVWGGLFGMVLVIESVMVSLFIKHDQVNVTFFSLAPIIPALLTSLGTAISEELLYRGFLLARFMRAWKSEIRANVVVSILFSAAHLGMGIITLRLTGTDLFVYIWSMFVLGFVDGFIYQRTYSVIAPIMAHTLWNFSLGIVRGIP